MRIIKIVVLLSLIQIPFWFANYVQDKMYAQKVIEERTIEKVLSTAMLDATTVINDYGGIELVEGTPELVMDPKKVVTTFLDSLRIQVDGIIDTKVVPSYVPFIAIADVDGVFYYEVVEEKNHLLGIYSEKENYIIEYPGDIRIQYYLNDHIRVYRGGRKIYDGLYYEKESVMPEGFDYEAEKIATTVHSIEDRMNQYYGTWFGTDDLIWLPLLQEDDWGSASSDVTIYALVCQMGGKPIRVVNNCGVGAKEHERPSKDGK